MAFSSGTYSLVAGNPVVTGTTISSTWANNTLNDVATALTTCLLKDGTQTATAKVPFAVGIDVTTEITTASTTFTAFAGATTLLTLGGTGATSVVAIPGTKAGTNATTASVTFAGGIAMAGNSFYGTFLGSDAALATPSALSATGSRSFASTVSGAALMGYGTTNDVSLMNRAGTVCLGVGPNTTNINIPATLNVTGLLTASTGVYANATASDTPNTGAGNMQGSASNWAIRTNTVGGFCIDTYSGGSSERFKITVGGVVTISALASGSLTSASGVITSSSDERLKDISGDLEYGLKEVVALKPIRYHWNKKSGIPTKPEYGGFGAKQVEESMPLAVSYGDDGMRGLSDRVILGALVNAVKELAAKA